MRILAISGSLRAASLNTAALEAVRCLAPIGVHVEIYREIDQLPHFNPDREGDNNPTVVDELRVLVGSCDGVLIACPEYAHGVPGAFKNLLDWLVGSVEFPDKPVALINLSPRSTHAQAALREILTTMSARLVMPACITLPLPNRSYGADEIAGEPELAASLRGALQAFIGAIETKLPDSNPTG